jgi:hypothetical protein
MPLFASANAFDLTGLAGQHGLVQHGGGAGHPAVDRHHLARADDQQVVDGHRGQGDKIAGSPARRAWRVREQGPQIVRGAPFRSRVQGVAGHQHDPDQRAGHVLVHRQRAHQRQHGDEVHTCPPPP